MCSLARRLCIIHSVVHHEPSETYIMNDFVNDYPDSKSQAIAVAIIKAKDMKWCCEIDEESIYAQMSSPEFRLYEEMIFCDGD